MSRHRGEPKPVALPIAAATTLLTALAVITGLVLNGNFAPPPERVPPAPPEAIIHERFAQEVREDIRTLHLMTNRELVQEAQDVCDALAEKPLVDVYNTHDFPTASPADASAFMGMSIAWRCPVYMGDMADLTYPEPANPYS